MSERPFSGTEPPSPPPPHPKHGLASAVYWYEQADGSPAFAVCRFETDGGGKTFLQGRPTARGWAWNLRGIEPVLYRLPELVAHLAAGSPDPVYICEGEKDAEALRAYLAEHELPGVVTCNPMGAGKWRATYTDALTGARLIVIVADNDEPGIAHARAVAAELRPHVDRLEVVLPALEEPKADLADHLAAGLGLDELVPLEGEEEAAAAVPFRIEVYSARDLCALPMPEEEPDLVGPFIRRGRVSLLGATTGHGKTTLGSQMLAAAVLGGEFLGWQVEGGRRVLVLDLEQHLDDIREQLEAVGLADADLLDYAPIPEGLAIESNPEHLLEVERVVAAKPYDIVRVDPFYKLHGADSSEEQEARPLVALTRRWVNTHGFGLLIDTHRRKQGEGGRGFSTDDLFGSSLFARDPEVILGLELVEEGRSRLHVLKARGRRGEIRTGQKLDLLYSDDELFRRVPEEDERDVRAELLALAADGAWRTLREWRAKPGAEDADATASNYVELRGGIGASDAKTKAVLLELQREGVFDYAEGPPSRAKDAKCWRLRGAATEAQGTPWQPVAPLRFEGLDDAAATVPLPPKGAPGAAEAALAAATEAPGQPHPDRKTDREESTPDDIPW